MTAKELAKRLDGSEYYDGLWRRLQLVSDEAKENGLVIVYGASDDLIEFDGAIHDEGGVYNGGDVYLKNDGFADDWEEYWNEASLRKISAFWCDPDTGASWSYKTDIPHETFKVYELGELYCIGLVFSIDDLGEGVTP